MKPVVVVMILCAAMLGQTAPEAVPGIGQKMKENAEALKQYSYKRRTEIRFKDKSRVSVEQVRYVNGQPETTPLETPAPPAAVGGGRSGLRGMMARKKIEEKKEEMKEEVARLKSLLQSYTTHGSDSMRQILEKATISRTGPGPNADVRVAATGVVQPSDSFTLLWSAASHRPEKIEIDTDLEKKPVQLAVEYSALPNGLFYPARTTISLPAKDLTVTVESFDYMPSVPSN
jgi:hypothetical protein